MFTGIITEVGEIISKKEKTEGIVLVVKAKDIAKQAKNGSSVCISGICLTVIKKEKNNLYFDVMPETLKKTSLGEKKEGDKVNLEGTLRVGDELGGHFVYGHVDGVGTVVSLEKQGDSRLIKFAPTQELMQFIAPQGSIGIDGVSLTVASFDKKTFTVSLIPFTLKNTTLGKLQVGDRVNLEADMLVKYIKQLNK
jgi:riboflavin synthase